MTNGVIDYTFALGVASALVGLVMVALAHVPSLAPGKPMRDTVTQILLFVFNLAAVLYTAAAAHQLNLGTGLLEYMAIALGPTMGHVLYTINPPAPAPAPAPTAPSGASVASVTAQVQAGVTQALSGNSAN